MILNKEINILNKIVSRYVFFFPKHKMIHVNILCIIIYFISKISIRFSNTFVY